MNGATAGRAVKVGVEARVWYPLKQLCERKGDLKEHVEKAIKTYLAILDGTLVLRFCSSDYYDVVDVNELEMKDAAGCTFQPLYGTFSPAVIERFVRIVAPYVIKPEDGRPYRISVDVTRREGEMTVTQSEPYYCDYLYPHVIANHVYSDEPVTMGFYREPSEEPMDELKHIDEYVYFEKDYIDVGVPAEMKGQKGEEQERPIEAVREKPELPDQELLEDDREMYVQFRVDGDLWDAFTGIVKRRKGDVSRSFNEALKIYLGGIWNTLVVKEYYEFEYFPEHKRRVVNIVYEFMNYDPNVKYRPVGKAESSKKVFIEATFTEAVIRAVVRKLGKPYAYMDIHRPLRFRKCDGLTEDEIVKMVLDDYMMLYRVDEYNQIAVTKNSINPASLRIEF